jgi:hypothetical protein
MDLQTYRETSLQTWDDLAPGWEDRREWMWLSWRTRRAVIERYLYYPGSWRHGELNPAERSL